MGKTRILKNAAGNICIICSLAFFIVLILDWYNPFMDFFGHSRMLLYPLCICSVYMGIGNLEQQEKNTKIKKKNRR